MRENEKRKQAEKEALKKHSKHIENHLLAIEGIDGGGSGGGPRSQSVP